MKNRIFALALATVMTLATQGVFAQDAAAVSGSAPLPAQALSAQYALAMHGDLKYPADFTHLDYVNPDAPKGGDIRFAATGTFDTLNPYILKGVAAPGLSLLFQTLMANTDDEAFSEYGLIAQSVETPPDRSWVVFNLRPEAKFNDGTPITADDVVWTFNTLMEKGHPFYHAYYANVKSAVAENAHRVKFTFSMAGNRELPLIMGQMPVLSKKDWAGKDFSKTTLKAPLGSGPYRIKSSDTARRITYEHVKDWWAKDLPIVKGQYNFDTITYDMYRDDSVLLQAFFSGEYDVRQENVAKFWSTEYDGQKPVKQGLIKKVEIKHEIPTGLQAFAYNTRRPMFSDPRVRQALNYAFDFEWSNKALAYGAYKRTESYFENSELAARGVPQGRELEILEKFKGQVPAEVFTQAYSNPHTSGSGQDLRANLGVAKKLLTEAGWAIGKSGLLEKDGQPLRFEILVDSDVFTRWINPFIGNLKRLGVEAHLRIVDSAQYQNRMDGFDFDMTIANFGESLSPGNEQRDFWSSAKADVKGSRNLIGIKNPVVDQLVDMIIAAPDRAELIARTHALDRVLLWNYYVIPQWYYDRHRVAYWDKFDRPAMTPKYGLGIIDTWWYDATRAHKIAEKINPAGTPDGDAAKTGGQ